MRSTDDWVIFQPILRVRQCSVAFKYTKYHGQTSKFQAYHSPQQICTANMYNHYIVPPCCEEHMCFTCTVLYNRENICIPHGPNVSFISGSPWAQVCIHLACFMYTRAESQMKYFLPFLQETDLAVPSSPEYFK